jgi:hypothetical protein
MADTDAELSMESEPDRNKTTDNVVPFVQPRRDRGASRI